MEDNKIKNKLYVVMILDTNDFVSGMYDKNVSMVPDTYSAMLFTTYNKTYNMMKKVNRLYHKEKSIVCRISNHEYGDYWWKVMNENAI